MMQRPRVIPTVRMVQVCPPIVVQTDLSNFRTVVQELTGNRKNIISPSSCCDHQDNNTPKILDYSPLAVNPRDHREKRNAGLVISDGSSTNWTTSSSSDNSISPQQLQQEVTSSLIIWNHEESNPKQDCSIMQHLVVGGDGDIGDGSGAGGGGGGSPPPSKKAKLINKKISKGTSTPNQDNYHHNHTLISMLNMDILVSEMFSHEETLDFTPPFSALDHLTASTTSLFTTGDLDADLQELCDLEIFPFSA